MKDIPEEQHNLEVQENLRFWEQKPVLRKIYHDFYKKISGFINTEKKGTIVELGSGIGNLKSVIPGAICTDLFDNPWIDQVENAYNLSFEDNTVSHLILFDVFHHLQYPGTALNEFKRVLKSNGRVILFEPDISLLGWLVYGLFHHEPVNLFKHINWEIPSDKHPNSLNYYAAQGNASRIFLHGRYRNRLANWNMIGIQRICSISYIASGGYSKPQLYPDRWYPALARADKLLGFLPALFSTRLLIVMENKKSMPH